MKLPGIANIEAIALLQGHYEMQEEQKKKAFVNWKPNGVIIRFPNGNSLSTIWGWGSYSENHDADEIFLGSNNVEIMVGCSDKLRRRLNKKFDHDPDTTVMGYVDITDWLYIINALAKEKETE